ncbi:deoxyribonuclease V [Kroppenstedtia eburnea]|uniref:Endonuclease V n=1 Tax=Kroppenstedtia eburnea TaxID=714067 RepID=A0A1N7Q1S4_9BACL|nr:deoxyribonuclease V [Kroppenstedtia eburnea]QKI82655.1 deoxyribonuclease V [Kroppenstedtia eburnea]SIT16844.1 Endonuclease V [Kroppenstedtia eburnea]
MEPVNEHPWNLDVEEALLLQQKLATCVIQEDSLQKIETVAGVDVAYHPVSDALIAAVVVLDAVTLHPVQSVRVEDQVHFPYIPGLFSFRELPPIIKAMKKLTLRPDLIVCDGQGIAHPRRFGLASHLGVLFDVPTIGCGKTRLVGSAQEPGQKRGDFTPLVDDDEVIGSLLRTQDHIKPVCVSIGHRISLATARDWILKLSPRYRLPETTRQSDQLVRRALAQSRQ